MYSSLDDNEKLLSRETCSPEGAQASNAYLNSRLSPYPNTMAGALEQASDALEPRAARASAKRLNDQVFRVCMLKAGFTEESQCVANCEARVSEHEVNVFKKMKLLRSGMAMSTLKHLMGKPFYTGKPFYIEFSGS